MKEDIQLVDEYKMVSVQLLTCLQSKNMENILLYLEQRQKIIEEINIKADKGGLIEAFKSINIEALDKDITKLIEENLIEIKNKIKKINEKAVFGDKYKSRFSGNSLFFSKKV